MAAETQVSELDDGHGGTAALHCSVLTVPGHGEEQRGAHGLREREAKP